MLLLYAVLAVISVGFTHAPGFMPRHPTVENGKSPDDNAATWYAPDRPAKLFQARTMYRVVRASGQWTLVFGSSATLLSLGGLRPVSRFSQGLRVGRTGFVIRQLTTALACGVERLTAPNSNSCLCCRSLRVSSAWLRASVFALKTSGLFWWPRRRWSPVSALLNGWPACIALPLWSELHRHRRRMHG